MAAHWRTLAALAVVLGWQSPLPEAPALRPVATASVQPQIPALQAPVHGVDAEEFARSASADSSAEPMLTEGLRDRLETLLLEAGDASEPSALKQRLAGLIEQHFAAAFVTPALALTERYVDYRVALGQLRAAQTPSDLHALRAALEAREKIRRQFFDDAERDALFARESELDRYTLARLEVAHHPELTAEQRAQALQAAENELSEQHLAQRNAAIEHMAAAAQTAAFNAQNADDYTRHRARSAQYGEAAAQALAKLDREEQSWQQRLDLYNQARAQQSDAAQQQLRAQLFSTEELQRVDAALALRRLQAAATSPG